MHFIPLRTPLTTTGRAVNVRIHWISSHVRLGSSNEYPTLDLRFEPPTSDPPFGFTFGNLEKKNHFCNSCGYLNSKQNLLSIRNKNKKICKAKFICTLSSSEKLFII